MSANGEDDLVYDVSSGKLLATLTDTKHASFSRDGTLLIGGNSKHLIVWRPRIGARLVTLQTAMVT